MSSVNNIAACMSPPAQLAAKPDAVSGSAPVCTTERDGPQQPFDAVMKKALSGQSGAREPAKAPQKSDGTTAATEAAAASGPTAAPAGPAGQAPVTTNGLAGLAQMLAQIITAEVPAQTPAQVQAAPAASEEDVTVTTLLTAESAGQSVSAAVQPATAGTILDMTATPVPAFFAPAPTASISAPTPVYGGDEQAVPATGMERVQTVTSQLPVERSERQPLAVLHMLENVDPKSTQELPGPLVKEALAKIGNANEALPVKAETASVQTPDDHAGTTSAQSAAKADSRPAPQALRGAQQAQPKSPEMTVFEQAVRQAAAKQEPASAKQSSRQEPVQSESETEHRAAAVGSQKSEAAAPVRTQSDAGESSVKQDVASHTAVPMPVKQAAETAHTAFPQAFQGALKTEMTAQTAAAAKSATPSLIQQVVQTSVTEFVNDMKVHLNAGATEMRIQLKPEALGEVSVRVIMEEGRMTAQMEFARPAVKAAMETQMPLIRESLATRGIEVTRLELLSSQTSLDRESTGGGQGQAQHHQHGRRYHGGDETAEYAEMRHLGYNTMELTL